MEVRAMHKAGSNQAEVEIYHEGKLIAKLECSDEFGSQRFTLALPHDSPQNVRRRLVIAANDDHLEVQRKLLE
jgi:hypothetical protein